MKLVYTYVKKYASANYHSCADEPLKSQCKVLLSQCQQHNSRLLEKERLANEIAVLLRIKCISEQMEGKREAERRCLGEDIEEINENLLKIATASSSEKDELRATASNLSERNSELQEQLQRCSMDCDMKSKLLESLQIKVSGMEELILGEFNALESPVSLSNKFEALVLKFHLSNEDACSFLKAWLPGPLAGQLSAQVNDNLADAEVRRKELQHIVDSRDNGMSDLQLIKLRRGDDPILFCSEYLALYTKVFNCPDLLEDDTSFIYSMANKCYVSYPTRMALRNARSYQNFVNILRDFCQGSSDREYGSKAGVSVISRGTGRQRECRHSK
ncbi:hypothetical protein AB205_0056150 [Aquarana catesbeiana]|uniref:Uncharacterized protein n=1 Tax=Aquarana catesbeiana TaxID=8400 RepID=A0A2G9QKJ3_AQUCT|nr:hypothetical protein AB205_0056150 [Aquarana catesbeiana]